jgi:hypothetical protein
MTWLEDAENDLQELKMKRLSQKPNNKEEWTSAVKEVKVLGRLYSQGVNKEKVSILYRTDLTILKTPNLGQSRLGIDINIFIVKEN